MKIGTIAIIDDDHFVRDSLKAELARRRFEVLTAEDGQAGLRLIQDIQKPCLFLVDLLMPHIDGWALIEHIREKQNAGLQHRIILLSGAAGADNIARQEEVGLIAKPFNLREVLAEIERRL